MGSDWNRVNPDGSDIRVMVIAIRMNTGGSNRGSTRQLWAVGKMLNTEIFKAHSAILIFRFLYFAVALSSNWTTNIFEILLELVLIYSGEIPLSEHGINMRARSNEKAHSYTKQIIGSLEFLYVTGEKGH